MTQEEEKRLARIEYSRQWRKAHPNYNKQYYAENREREKKRSREYKENHKTETLAYFRKRYFENRERDLVKNAEYYKKHKQEIKLRKAKFRKQQFCNEDLSKIENYDKAVKDNFVGWVIHHRLETVGNGLTRDELKAKDMYFNRPPQELIFLKTGEHRKIHLAFNRNKELKKNECL